MELAEKIRLRGEETSVGLAYEHLKRVRVREKGYIMISPNVRYLDCVVKLLGLEGAKPVPTPLVASHRTAMSLAVLRVGQGGRAVRGVLLGNVHQGAN